MELLFEKYPHVNKEFMGFLSDWRQLLLAE